MSRGAAAPARKRKSPRQKARAWSWKPDSNRRPTHYECVALPTELYQHNEGKSLVFENKHQINTKLT